MLGQNILEAVEQIIGPQGQAIHPAAVGAITEQNLNQVFNIQLIVAPSTGDILCSQQQIPARLTETIGLMGQAALHRRGLRHQAVAKAREASWINSIL